MFHNATMLALAEDVLESCLPPEVKQLNSDNILREVSVPSDYIIRK